jgi:outer membrane protein TolC
MMYSVRAAIISKRTFFTLGMMFVMALAVMTAEPDAVRAQEAKDQGLPILGLRDCIRIALEDSPTLLVEDERRHIASQDVTGAWGQFLPTISLGYDWQKAERTDYDQDQFDAGPTLNIMTQEGIDIPYPTYIPAGTADETIYTKYQGFNGRANLNIFNGFSKFSQLSSAKNSLHAAEATREYTRELVVEDVTGAYFNLLRYQRLHEVAIETREQQELELERTETYFRLGSAAKSDVLQQRVQLENTKLDVVVADNNVKKAFADLAYLMNHPLAEGFAIDTSILDTDYHVPVVEALYEEALGQRLDLASSEYNLEARNKDVTTATSNAWPTFDVYVNYNAYNNDTPYILGGQKSSQTTFGWTASWNVFDRLQTWTGRSQAKANARIAEYQLQQAKLNVQVEIRQLHNSMVEAKERAHVSEETIIQSEEELRLARERFRVGAGTTLDVIVAQANLANSRAQEVQAMCDFLIARTMMYRAIGRTNSWAEVQTPAQEEMREELKEGGQLGDPVETGSEEETDG